MNETPLFMTEIRQNPVFSPSIRVYESGLINIYYTPDRPMYHTLILTTSAFFTLCKFLRIRDMLENGRRESTKRVRRRAKVRERINIDTVVTSGGTPLKVRDINLSVINLAT